MDVFEHITYCLFSIWGRGVILWYQEITPRLLIAHCKMNPTHSWGSYSMMYRHDSGNINLSLKNYSYTSCSAAWSKRYVCKSRIGSYSLIFLNDFGMFIWLQHNTLYGLNDSECLHFPCHLMDKNGESLDNEMRNLHLGWLHVKKYLSSSSKRGFI